jgi:hypothetical protein
MAPKTATRQNPAIPTKAVWTSPGLARRAGQHGGQGQDGQPQQCAHVQQREGGEPAHRDVGVESGGGKHLELDGGTGRAAARQDAADRVAG